MSVAARSISRSLSGPLELLQEARGVIVQDERAGMSGGEAVDDYAHVDVPGHLLRIGAGDLRERMLGNHLIVGGAPESVVIGDEGGCRPVNDREFFGERVRDGRNGSCAEPGIPLSTSLPLIRPKIW